MTAFPEFKGRDLYISGESYAGKYIPYYAWKLYNTQTDAGDSALWNLKGTLTGDPYTAPLTQRMQMWTPPSGLNLVDKSNKPQLAALMKKCAEQLNLDQNLST
jgi:carboxypeptidase C (cathepsin A)